MFVKARMGKSHLVENPVNMMKGLKLQPCSECSKKNDCPLDISCNLNSLF